MAKSRKKANVVVVVLSPGPIPQVLVPVVVVRVQEELKYEKTKKKINSNLGFLLILFFKKFLHLSGLILAVLHVHAQVTHHLNKFVKREKNYLQLFASFFTHRGDKVVQLGEFHVLLVGSELF